MAKRTGLLLILIASWVGLRCPAQTIVPGTPGFCSDKMDRLYCLLPILFDEANPNPFTPITSAFATQLTQLPLASPASGILYTIDPRIAIPVRSGQETYGPVLTERGDTIGQYALFVAFTYQRFTFSSLDGISLNKIPVVFNVCSITGQCAPIGTTNQLTLNVNQYALFATFGLTNRIDVSMAVPINSVSESASSTSCAPCNGPIDYSNPSNPIQYVFKPAALSEQRVGLGDIVFRIKGQVFKGEAYKLAVGSDFRAPTGDELNLLGSGASGVRPFLAFSRGGRVSPHINVAYQWNGSSILGSETAGQQGKLANDFFYSAGVDAALGSKITVAVDFLGDYVSNQFRLKGVMTTTSPGTTVPNVDVVTGSFMTAKGSVGFKYNPVTNFLVTGNVLFRLDHNGLRNDPVPLAGVSYTF
jgi:hypothetical protein